VQILIVADSEAVGQWLTLVLQARGHQVTWQRSGASGCDYLVANPVDVVVAESFLPDGGSDEWLRAFRAARASARIVLVFPPTTAGVLAHAADAALMQPFSRETLLTTMARLAETATAPAAVALPPSPDTPPPVVPVMPAAPPERIAGGLAEALVELAQRGANGVLHVGNENVRRRVTIRGGAPTNVSGDYSTDNFGRFLVRRALVDDATLERSHQLMASQGLAQAEALVQLGVFSSAKLFDLLRAFQYEKLLNMFGWAEPDITFDADAVVPPGEAVYEMDPSLVVLDGFQRYGSVPQLYAWLETCADHYLVRTDRFHEMYAALHAASPRIPLLQLTAGDLPVAQLLNKMPIDSVLSLRALRALELLGLVRTAAKPTPAVDLQPAEVGPVVGEYGLAVSASSEGDGDVELTLDEKTALEEIFSAYLSLQFRDHYALLGVPRNAGASEVEQAHLRAHAAFERALRLHSRHPSAHAKAAEVLVHLGFARSVLSNPQTRAAYDQQLERKDSQRLERRINLGAETRFKSGLALLRSGRAHAARIEFEAARSLRPGDGLCLLYASWANYLELQETARQIAALRDGIVESARMLGDAEGLAFGAQIFFDLGCRDLVLPLVRQALQLDGQCALARSLADAIEERVSGPAPTAS